MMMMTMGQLANLFLVASNFNFPERFYLFLNHIKYTIFFFKNNNNNNSKGWKIQNLIKIAKKKKKKKEKKKGICERSACWRSCISGSALSRTDDRARVCDSRRCRCVCVWGLYLVSRVGFAEEEEEEEEEGEEEEEAGEEFHGF